MASMMVGISVLYTSLEMCLLTCYLGDGSDSSMSGPPGSAAIEKLFQDYFKSKGEPYDPSEFDGRSDYGPFIVSCMKSYCPDHDH